MCKFCISLKTYFFLNTYMLWECLEKLKYHIMKTHNWVEERLVQLMHDIYESRWNGRNYSHGLAPARIGYNNLTYYEWYEWMPRPYSYILNRGYDGIHICWIGSIIHIGIRTYDVMMTSSKNSKWSK